MKDLELLLDEIETREEAEEWFHEQQFLKLKIKKKERENINTYN